MKKLFLFVCLLSFYHNFNFAQSPTFNLPYKPGEKLTYKTSYQLKGPWTDVAGIEMEVVDVPGKKKPVYRLKFSALTYSSWDTYLKVRHSYQTWIEPETSKPIMVKQDSDIKGNIKKASYTFKFKSGIVNIEAEGTGLQPIKKDLKITANTFDIVSLLYYMRTLDFEKIKPGKTYPTSILVLERILKVNIKYVGNETIEVAGLGKRNCYKMALILDNDFVVKKDATFVWLTADSKRIPVQISTTYKEGQGFVKLEKAEGI
jgi:hypothetical protein